MKASELNNPKKLSFNIARNSVQTPIKVARDREDAMLNDRRSLDYNVQNLNATNNDGKQRKIKSGRAKSKMSKQDGSPGKDASQVKNTMIAQDQRSQMSKNTQMSINKPNIGIGYQLEQIHAGQVPGSLTERAINKDKDQTKVKKAKSKNTKQQRPTSQMGGIRNFVAINQKVLQSQQKIQNLMRQRQQMSVDRQFKNDNPQIGKAKSVVKKQMQQYLSKPVEIKYVQESKAQPKTKSVKKTKRSKSKKTKKIGTLKSARINQAEDQPSFITDINGKKIVNLNTNRDANDNNMHVTNVSRDNFELLIQDQKSDQPFDQQNMAHQYQNMSSILHESAGDVESQEIPQFDQTPREKFLIIQGQSTENNNVSKYNKYLNNSQNGIENQDELTGGMQGHQANKSMLVEQDEIKQPQFNVYNESMQQRASHNDQNPNFNQIGNQRLANIEDDNQNDEEDQVENEQLEDQDVINEINQQSNRLSARLYVDQIINMVTNYEGDRNTQAQNVERNNARSYVNRLIRKSIDMDNPEFAIKLTDANLPPNVDQESNDGSNSSKPFKQQNENYVSVQNIYGVTDAQKQAYSKQLQQLKQQRADHAYDMAQDQNIEELRSRIHSTFDDLEQRINNASPIPQFVGKDYSEDSKQFLDDVAATNFELQDPTLKEQEMRSKGKNVKPTRLLQNDVKGQTRIPMTSGLRLELEQVRQKQKYVILQQEKERLLKQKEQEEDDLMKKNNIHKNVKGQKINVNDREFQEQMRRKHAIYFNKKQQNENKSQEQPRDSTYQPKINKNTNKIIKQANKRFRENSLQNSIPKFSQSNFGLNTQVLMNQSFEEWQKTKDLQFSGTGMINQGSSTDRNLNRFGEPMSQTINLNKVNSARQKSISTNIIKTNDKSSKFSSTQRTDLSKDKQGQSARLNLYKRSEQGMAKNQAQVDKKIMKKIEKIQKDRQDGKISFDDAVKSMNEVYQNATRDEHFKVTEQNKIAQEKLAIQQQYMSGTSKGQDLYAKNNKFKKYLNVGSNKHQKQFKSIRATSKKAAKTKNNNLEMKVSDSVRNAEIFDDERAANSGFQTPNRQELEDFQNQEAIIQDQKINSNGLSVPDLKSQLFNAIQKLYVSKIPPVPQNMPKMPPLPEIKQQTLTTQKAPPAPSQVAPVPALDPSIIKRNSIFVPPPPQVPLLKKQLAEAIKKLYMSKIPAPPSNVPVPPPLPKQQSLPKLTKTDAPMAPQNVAKVPEINPEILKRNSILVPPPPNLPQVQNKLAEAIMKLYKSKIPAPPKVSQPAPPPPKQEMPTLTTSQAPKAPEGIQKAPQINPAILKRNSIMVPPPPSIPLLSNKLADAIKKLYQSKIPAPPKNAINMPPPPKDIIAHTNLTTQNAPRAPDTIKQAPPLDPAVIKRQSIMVPPPPSIPDLKLKLAQGLRKLYMSKIPAPPANAPVPPPLPKQNELPLLTNRNAPEAPKNVKKVPAIDPAVMRRQSIMVPPPPSIQLLQLSQARSSIKVQLPIIFEELKKPGIPELGYWNIRGQAQSIRYQLIYQGIQFNDTKYNFGEGDKIDAEWKVQKNNLGLQFAELPYFIDGNVKMSCTLAIHQYIGDKWDRSVVGNNLRERSKAMMLGNIISQFRLNITKSHLTNDKKEESLQEVSTLLPSILKFQGKNKFLCTSQKPTWVDFYFLEVINLLRWITDSKILSDYPALKIYYDEMCNLPLLKEHLRDPQAQERKLEFNEKLAKINGIQNW